MGAYQVRTALNLSEAGQVLAPDRGLTSSIHEYTAHTLILSTPSDPFGEITQEENLVNLPGRIESRMVGTLTLKDDLSSTWDQNCVGITLTYYPSSRTQCVRSICTNASTKPALRRLDYDEADLVASHRTYLPLLRSPAAGRGVHESGGVIRPCGLTPLLPPNTVPTQDRSFLLPTSTRQGLLRRRYQLHVSRETAVRTPAIHLLRRDLLRPPSPCISRETCLAKRSRRPQAVPL